MIIWDFDGVIVDSRALALEYAQSQFHGVTEDIHRDMFNGNIFTESAKLEKKFATEEEHDLYLEKVYWPKKMELVPIPGMKEVVEALSEEYSMTVNSSASSGQITRYLEKNGLMNNFQKVYGNEVRSKEEKFRMILRDFGLSAEECVFITDSIGDVREAQAVRIPAIAVLWGFQLRRHFEPVRDEVMFAEQPAELVGLVRQRFAAGA